MYAYYMYIWCLWFGGGGKYYQIPTEGGMVLSIQEKQDDFEL